MKASLVPSSSFTGEVTVMVIGYAAGVTTLGTYESVADCRLLELLSVWLIVEDANVW